MDCNFLVFIFVPPRPDDVETRNVIIHNIHAVNGETISGVSMDTEVVNTSEVVCDIQITICCGIRYLCYTILLKQRKDYYSCEAEDSMK